MKNLITCLAVSLISGVAFADTWTVDDDGKADFNNIQAAIDAASDGDEIIVMPGTYTSTSGEVVYMLGKALHLHSSDGAQVTIIDGEGTRRGLTLTNYEPAETIIEGFTIANCFTGGSGGGALFHYSDATLLDCLFIDNGAGNYGGGMYAEFGSPIFTGCVFSNNSASYGGGILFDNSYPSLTGCSFNGNVASSAGGGIYNKWGTMVVASCSFTGNASFGHSGAVRDLHSQTSWTDCSFDSNTAVENGGAILNDDCSGLFDNCVFTNNTTNEQGGGMYNLDGSSPTLTNCIFTGNNSEIYGGGMCNMDSSPTLTNCTFMSNTSTDDGGGIYLSGSNAIISNCSIISNTTTKDGAGIACIDSNPDISDCLIESNEITGNTSNAWGGGIYCLRSNPTLIRCEIQFNSSVSVGGGMYNDQSTPSLTDTTVCGNTPDQIVGDWTDNGGNSIAEFCWLDCNDNGIDDAEDIANQTSFDCDGNGVPDECQPDCDGDGWIDPCDNEGDCDDDGIPDNCELDCNENGIPDDCDIIYGISQDCNENGIPDECDIATDPTLDCDTNGVIDSCEILNDPSLDCNDNGVLDTCELAGGVPPEGAVQWTIEEGGNGHWYQSVLVPSGITWLDANAATIGMGGYLVSITSEDESQWIREQVSSNPELWTDGWGSQNAGPYIGASHDGDSWSWTTNETWSYTNWHPGNPNNIPNAVVVLFDLDGSDGGYGWQDVNHPPGPDWIISYIVEWDTLPALLSDCNENGIPDECDIADGTSNDVNDNDIPDECEVDCNGNGIPDHWDIKTGTSEDCNDNGIPDECDIADGTSNDVNDNDIPDECEPDCNGNGIPDAWDIETGAAIDCNGNGIPDSCDATSCVFDCNLNGVPDSCDIANGTSEDINANNVPDECECIADITGDGVVNIHDLLALIGYWGSSGPLGDFNADGIVNIHDLLILIAGWGECTNIICNDDPPIGAVQWPISEGGNGHWYRYNWDQTTGPEGVCWSEARERCLIDGGDLVSVSSQAESDFIQSTICPMAADAGGNLGWLGLMPDGNGALMWSNGEAVNWTNWDTGQPSGDGSYATFVGGCAGSDAGNPMTWNDIGGTGGCHNSNETPLAFWITEWSN